ncbi:MAG: ankyrin repeat domain-containing protein [Spirochaetes bacterium]|nr:MAG: ankyrin repeat domain-containing protein [Spirochaetota bacterium]
MSDFFDISNYELLGENPIFSASEENQTDIIKILADQGVNLNQVDQEFVTPLMTSCYYGNLNATLTLIEKGAEVNQSVNGVTAILLAAQVGDVDIITALLLNGANPNQPDEGTAPNWVYGYKPIIIAAQNGNIDAVIKLLDNGANINDKNAEGCTALYTVCWVGNLQMVQTLIERGADKTIPNNYGMTPTFIAEQQGFTDIVDYLNSV